MINIISVINKGSNSNENCSNIEDNSKDRIDDITQNTRCKIFYKTKAFSSAFILILCISLTGCGKTDDIVTDYGYQTENADKGQNGEDGGDTDGETNVKDGASGEHGISAAGQTVREMVGGEKLEFEDSLEADGVSINIRAKCDIPDVASLAAYQVHRVSGDKVEEDEVVKNLFGDTAVMLDELPVSREGKTTGHAYTNIWGVYDNIRIDFGYGIYDYDFNTDKMVRLDHDDFFVHIYQGKYEGTDYYLLYAYSDYSMIRTIYFTPVSLEEYWGTGEYDEFEIYEQGNNGEELENRLDFSETELTDICADFVENKLGLSVYNGMISSNTKDKYRNYSSSPKNHIVFTSLEDWQKAFDDNTVTDDDGLSTIKIGPSEAAFIVASTGLVDGYELYFSQKMSGIFQKMKRTSDENNRNQGSIMVTSRGIMTVWLENGIDVDDITENVQILDGEKIKESFKAALSDNLDRDKLGDTNKLLFDEMELLYYPVQNPSDVKELTYIPAWSFTTKRALSDDKWCYLSVYINAIDGTLIDIEYNYEE